MSSSSSSDDEETPTTSTNTLTLTKTNTNTNNNNNTNNNTIIQQDGSILFQPHRTIGLITTNQPYTLSKDKTKSHIDTFLTMPLQERFVIYKCDSLKPVLVSNHLPGTKNSHRGSKGLSSGSNNGSGSGSGSSKGEKMFHAISDSSLGLTVATHAYKGRWNASHLTLYKRTRVIDTRRIVRNDSDNGNSSSSNWGIVQVLNLGRSKFPVQKSLRTGKNDRDGDTDMDGMDDDHDDNGSSSTSTHKMENCMLMAIICAKHSLLDDSNDANDGVEIIGDDSDSNDDDDDDDSSTSSDSSNDNDNTIQSTQSKKKSCRGEVIIVIASRYNLTIQKRIPLNQINIPTNFTPSISMHPHTYINKIVIGSTGGELVLLNIRSGKVIHLFKCLDTNSDNSSGRGSGSSRSSRYQNGKITVLEQSPAVDTIAVGTESGKVHLVNIRMDVKLFTLFHDSISKGRSSMSSSNMSRKKKMGITSLSFRTDASALEYGIAPLAVGQLNGSISIWDLTPRSNGDSDDDMDDDDDANTNTKQRNTNESRRTLLCQMDNAHPGGVCQLNYLPQEPLLLSSGMTSNCLVMHIFDNPNHTGRILRQRVGHVAPPTLIQYQHSSNGGILASMADGTDASSCQILSCGGKGDRSLRLFSTARSVLDREFSQGKGLVKKASELGLNKADLYLNEIVGLATSSARSRDWGDVVTIHKDHSMAYVWSTKRKAQSGPVLRQDGWNVSTMKVQPPKSSHATSLAISSCGHFAIVGTKGGTIYKYNIQSGLPRGSFPRDATNNNANMKKNRQVAGNVNRTTKMLERSLKIYKVHEKEKDDHVIRLENQRRIKLEASRHKDAAVVGLAVDTLNKTLISVGSDSKLIMWSFATHAPHRRSPILLSAPATKLVHTRDSDLLAIALEDYSVIMFDCSSLSVVRRFGSSESQNRHTGPISDLAFGPDGRKLFTSSMDGSLRVWDVPTSTCVDWMTFASAPTSLALSSTGEFLATSHQGRLGISLWCDRSFFQTIHLGVKPPTKPFQMDEPAAAAEEENNDELALRAMQANKAIKIANQLDIDKDLGLDNESTGRTIPVPKKEGLITLSGLPAAHWKNLFNLELVKERNKPKEAPKKPPSAPFFLQWRGGSESKLPPLDNDKTEKGEKADEEEWEAAWSDDEVDQNESNLSESNDNTNKRKSDNNDTSQADKKSQSKISDSNITKRTKITHARSDLASLLQRSSQTSDFDQVTVYLASMGPSAIDVAFSTLCHGMHDLEEGLPLLHIASLWFLQACETKKNYEVINAYLHRFLHIHSSTIAGIDASWQEEEKTKYPSDIINDKEAHVNRELRLELLDSIKKLRIAHREATEGMRNKLQQSLCLLRHFSRIL